MPVWILQPDLGCGTIQYMLYRAVIFTKHKKGDEILHSIVIEKTDTQNAHAFVSDIREFREHLVIFDRNGRIHASRCADGSSLAGEDITKHMTVAEWSFLRKNCISYACARTVVDTHMGAMLVYCNMLASMHVMVGVIFKADRATVARYFHRKATMVDMLSPRIKELVIRGKDVEDKQAFDEVNEIATLSFSAFATAGIRQELGQSLLESTSYIIRRICCLSRMVGCRVNCRSVREFPPRTEDFYGNAFVAIVLNLLFFVYKNSASRTAEVEIGDFDARPRIIFRCELPEGEREVFVNRRFRYRELDECDQLAAEWLIPFECSAYDEGMKSRLRVAFCPKTKVVDGLHVKVPTKRLDYSDA